jgi:hypothetical protein
MEEKRPFRPFKQIKISGGLSNWAGPQNSVKRLRTVLQAREWAAERGGRCWIVVEGIGRVFEVISDARPKN